MALGIWVRTLEFRDHLLGDCDLANRCAGQTYVRRSYTLLIDALEGYSRMKRTVKYINAGVVALGKGIVYQMVVLDR